jgi:steroid delta-isomerase-like uncharacterized protein
MTSEQLKRLVRRDTEEIWNEGNFDVIDEIFAPGFVLHDPAAPEQSLGREEYREYVETFRAAFPDARYEIEDILAEGDTAALRYSARATNEGEFMDMDPTGEQVDVSGMEMYRVEDGKIVEMWTSYDALGLLQQLGRVPSLAELERTTSAD